MSKRFRIAKRISMEDIDRFEDIEVDDDFVDKDMAQIIADNEYDPMYDDCESIAVALKLAGYGKVADLETKLAESEERVKDLEFRNKNLEHSLKVAPNANAGQRQRIVELKEINHKLKQQLAEKEKEIETLKEEK